MTLKGKSFESIQSNITSLDLNTEKINTSNQNLLNEINILDKDIISLNTQVIKSDIGTYKFIAKAFNSDIESIVKIFILIIVVIFDPLALCLLLAFNFVLNEDKSIISLPINKIKDIYKKFKRGTKSTHNKELADPNL